MTDRWVVELTEDHETGELLLTFPPEFLAQMGWDFGDTIKWDLQGDVVVLTKQDDQDQL